MMANNKKAKSRTGQVDPLVSMTAQNTPESNQVRFIGTNKQSSSMKNAGKRKLPFQVKANY